MGARMCRGTDLQNPLYKTSQPWSTAQVLLNTCPPCLTCLCTVDVLPSQYEQISQRGVETAWCRTPDPPCSWGQTHLPVYTWQHISKWQNHSVIIVKYWRNKPNYRVKEKATCLLPAWSWRWASAVDVWAAPASWTCWRRWRRRACEGRCTRSAACTPGDRRGRSPAHLVDSTQSSQAGAGKFHCWYEFMYISLYLTL